jgi:hypothetical protein
LGFVGAGFKPAPTKPRNSLTNLPNHYFLCLYSCAVYE